MKKKPTTVTTTINEKDATLMATICPFDTKCKACKHYRKDHDDDRMARFLEHDIESDQRALLAKAKLCELNKQKERNG